MDAETDLEERLAVEIGGGVGPRPRALDHVAVAVEERPDTGFVVDVGLEEAGSVLADRDGRALVAFDSREVGRRQLEQQDGGLVRRVDHDGRPKDLEALGREAGFDPGEGFVELWVELVVDDVGRLEDDGDRRRLAAGQLLVDRSSGQWLPVGREEQREIGVGEESAGVVLEPGDVFGRTHRRHVAVGIGGVDHDQGIVERRGAVVFRVEDDWWRPVDGRFQQRNDPAVLDDQ